MRNRSHKEAKKKPPDKGAVATMACLQQLIWELADNANADGAAGILVDGHTEQAIMSLLVPKSRQQAPSVGMARTPCTPTTVVP